MWQNFDLFFKTEEDEERAWSWSEKKDKAVGLGENVFKKLWI